MNTSPPPGPAARQTLTGVLLLIVSMWALSGLDASGKYLMGADIGAPLFVVCLLRYGVHTALTLFTIIPARGWKALRCSQPRAQVTRGLSMLAATMLFFTTLHYLPLGQATAINFLAPLIVLAIAPWALKEPPFLSRWIAAGIGLLGVLVVVRPGSGLDPTGTLFGLMTACALASQYLSSRRVAVDDPYTTLIWSGAVGSMVMVLALPFYWRDLAALAMRLSATQWLVLLGTGFWGCLGHFLQIQAYRRAPASLLAPFVYFQIVSAAALGWLIWGQFPDPVSWLGIAVVCASGITIGLIEWRRNRARRAV
ncbi:DMT family transporter [Castellaniella denitrificans]|uniref:DMT family transporter n=1 Tax=Castellaniella denitrificans TaxID=56119 RepID=A0ABT4M3B4_9BURK|nr:DMT family transporter [Castellaniella denitrificans]MCZ4329776.1 DMT family transporter [Castellaniella denitrificans]